MPKKDIVYYGYPNTLDYNELINLTLIHDKIYDSNDLLSDIFSLSPYLAEMLDNLDNINKNYFKEIFNNKDIIDRYSDLFILITSIARYHGLNPKDWWRIPRKGEMIWNNRIFSIDKLDTVNDKNAEKFIEIIIPSFKRAYKRDPNVIKKTIDTLNDLPLLSKYLVKRSKYSHQSSNVYKKWRDVIWEAVDLDLEDPKFYSTFKHEFDSVLCNLQIFVSSELEMPLHMSPPFSDFIEYKFLRGPKKDINNLKQRKNYEEAYNLFIPEIYAANIKTLIELKEQKVFKEFRKETGNIINQWFEDSSYTSNFSEYLNEQYIKEMETIATAKVQNKKKILLKGLLGNLDSLFGSIPVVSTLITGKELLDTYHDKKKYKFALSVIGVKNKIRELKY
jgi:hypothetical protein